MKRVGTDFSGIEAPLQALNKLRVKYDHLFSCEIDKYARQSIKANYEPKVIFEDVTVERDLPELDIYVGGFPCQSFSTIGKRKGNEDPRGNLFFNCLEAIKKTSPKIFILENVSGIMTIHNGEFFKTIKEELAKLEGYSIHYWILNTKDYGIPQNRKRVYMIGIKSESVMTIPEKLECLPIDNFIDYTCTTREEYCKTYKDREPQFKDAVFANISALRPDKNEKNKVNPNHSPCITANHPLWNVKMHRRATIKENLKLQGFPEEFIQVVSDAQMRKQIGNSMSVNVLVEIFKKCFDALNIPYNNEIVNK